MPNPVNNLKTPRDERNLLFSETDAFIMYANRYATPYYGKDVDTSSVDKDTFLKESDARRAQTLESKASWEKRYATRPGETDNEWIARLINESTHRSETTAAKYKGNKLKIDLMGDDFYTRANEEIR